MAEMTTLTAAIYRKYSTNMAPGTEDLSPGVTSRFEVFCDETMPRMKVGFLIHLESCDLIQLHRNTIARLSLQIFARMILFSYRPLFLKGSVIGKSAGDEHHSSNPAFYLRYSRFFRPVISSGFHAKRL